MSCSSARRSFPRSWRSAGTAGDTGAPGDLVFSFRDTLIQAIGVATDYCFEAPKPADFGETGRYWNRIGWKVPVHWTLLANRVGYLVLSLAVALFVMAFLFGFSPTMATLIIVTMVVSFVLLAPSIVLGYAVKAAERDDVERGF